MATEAPLPVEAHAHDAPVPDAAAAADATHKPKRSWRRKYRKMRVRFDDAMNDSNSLIQQEWKAMGTARRLQETNDQLLEMLLDLNAETRVHPRLCFDLENGSTHNAAAPSREPAADPEHIKQQLQSLRDDLANGKITADEYTAQADQLHASQSIQQTITTLASLEAKIPHTKRQDLPSQAIDGIDLTESAPGFMSPTHEEEYLLALDQALAEPGFDPSLQLGRPIRLVSAQQPLGDKDLTVRNPDSVYNWLRKHQPQVFLQDKDMAHPENMSEKSAPKNGGSKKAKRESAIGGGTPGPRDHDDEDSTAQETGKGRRKTGGDDDTAYRPKGGSSRPAKRKREEGDTPAGKSRSKKSRASTSAAA